MKQSATLAKTAGKKNNRNGNHNSAPETNGDGKTPAQISAHEYRNELQYLRFIMEKTNLSPAEIAEKINHVRKSPATRGELFRAFLDATPEGGDAESVVTLNLDVELHQHNWAELMTIARRENMTFEDAVYECLSHGVEDWTAHKIRKEWLMAPVKEKAGKVVAK